MKIREVKLPFALSGDILVHISEVERGKACACTCPACGAGLVAKKGDSQRHHFAHLNNADCAAALETALHLKAKEILAAAKEMTLPEVNVQFNGGKPPIPIAPETVCSIADAYLERHQGSVVPDVIVEIRGKHSVRQLAVEIFVTHKVDDEKTQRFASQELSAIEIDLSGFGREFDEAELDRMVLGPGKHKRWLFNAKREALSRQAWSKSRARPFVHRGMATHVDDCPIRARTFRGRAYANVIDDCIYSCCHCLDVKDEMVWCDG